MVLSPTKRLLSLDVFRGATVAAMMLANNAGDWEHVYQPLEHASWNGLTPTDLIFPFFIFIAGISMALSFTSRLAKGATKGQLLKHVVIRGLALYVLGFSLNGFPDYDFSSIRILGVLPRIGIAYLIVGILYLILDRRGLITTGTMILLGYWAVMLLVPVPGSGAGVLTPEGSLCGYIDRQFLTGHMWHLTKTWDPEGILSTFPSFVTMILGILLGIELVKDKPLSERIQTSFAWGTLLAAAGWAISYSFPVNKNLWSPSYVLVTGGFGMLAFSLCALRIDLKGNTRWTTPFVVFGRNALASYVLAEVVSKLFYTITLTVNGGKVSLILIIMGSFFSHIPDPYIASVSYALCFVGLMWLLAWALYSKNWIIRV